MSSPRCGKKYGTRRHLTCRRPAGHEGQHGKQYAVKDLRRERVGRS